MLQTANDAPCQLSLVGESHLRQGGGDCAGLRAVAFFNPVRKVEVGRAGNVGWFRSARDAMRAADRWLSTRCRQRNNESSAGVVPGAFEAPALA
jgi:hypothetical protein